MPGRSRHHDPVLVGVISDTHALLRPEAIAALKGARLIIHAGDVGSPDVLEGLRALAPVVAVRGNNDTGAWAHSLCETELVEVAGRRLYVVHDVKVLEADPAGFDAVIAGHSHRPMVEHRNGVLFLNPGSAGPRRFRLPVSVAHLRVGPSRLEARLVELECPVKR